MKVIFEPSRMQEVYLMNSYENLIPFNKKIVESSGENELDHKYSFFLNDKRSNKE